MVMNYSHEGTHMTPLIDCRGIYRTCFVERKTGKSFSLQSVKRVDRTC